MAKGAGSQELSRRAASYVASVAFALTFLIAQLRGADATTALLRGLVALAIALVAGRLLCAPVVDVVLAAMARDEAKRKAAQPKEDEA
jgi:Na+(H+)/acetate symporter ActP